MKAIMYHYVRPEPADAPFFRYLHIDDFRRQLDHFDKTFGFVARRAFLDCFAGGPPPEGVVLTFDDSLADHYRYVLPVLAERGLWGIFYVPTATLKSAALLAPHCIHRLIGRFGGAHMLALLKGMLSDEMIDRERAGELKGKLYRNQSGDDGEIEFKSILNYHVRPEWRQRLLDKLTAATGGGTERDRFYLTPGELKEIADAGMIVGSHSVSHRMMSELSVAEQRREIADSFAALAAAIGDGAVKTFCYPFGGRHTFTDDTERLLDDAGCAFSFSVEPRDIAAADCRAGRQRLPRYDCNAFPFGAASTGRTRAAANG